MSVNIYYNPLANKRKVCAPAQRIDSVILREHLVAADATEIEYQTLTKSFADRRAAERAARARFDAIERKISIAQRAISEIERLRDDLN